ncbi:MAG: ribokinase [Oscillospiraceae bacterium]|nr:ribokinase [Oscillospiraceae bacterium]
MSELKKILVIGSLNLDIVAKADRIPATGETVLARYGGQFGGGKGANQALAVAKLGGDVTMLGAVGADAAGDFLLRSLRENGVNVENVMRVPTEPTGQAWIVLNSRGDNSIVVLSGANSCVDAAYIDSMRPVIERADIVIMQLEIPIETVCHAACLAGSLGKTVILDPAPAVPDLPGELLANIDYVKPNETELELLTGCPTGEHQKGAQQLLVRGCKNVIVSLGERGVFCHESGKEAFYMPALPVKAVDTTAAGDSFLAAFALGLARGESVRACADFAQRVASIVVTRPGAQSSMPAAAELGKL